LSNSLESINLDFKKSFHSVFQKPELIQSFLTKRSNKFDAIIKKEFIRRELETDFALVALGGYGRKELFPSSDIDLSIIQFNSKTKKIEDIKDFIGWLWTLKVKVGHSVRTVKDIEKITKSDLKEFTSYLSYRIIFCEKNKVAGLKMI
jgi:[protein-PII] uridylyltransferase